MSDTYKEDSALAEVSRMSQSKRDELFNQAVDIFLARIFTGRDQITFPSMFSTEIAMLQGALEVTGLATFVLDGSGVYTITLTTERKQRRDSLV